MKYTNIDRGDTVEADIGVDTSLAEPDIGVHTILSRLIHFDQAAIYSHFTSIDQCAWHDP